MLYDFMGPSFRADIADRCAILYVEGADIPLKGALVEVWPSQTKFPWRW